MKQSTKRLLQHVIQETIADVKSGKLNIGGDMYNNSKGSRKLPPLSMDARAKGHGTPVAKETDKRDDLTKAVDAYAAEHNLSWEKSLAKLVMAHQGASEADREFMAMYKSHRAHVEAYLKAERATFAATQQMETSLKEINDIIAYNMELTGESKTQVLDAMKMENPRMFAEYQVALQRKYNIKQERA